MTTPSSQNLLLPNEGIYLSIGFFKTVLCNKDKDLKDQYIRNCFLGADYQQLTYNLQYRQDHDTSDRKLEEALHKLIDNPNILLHIKPNEKFYLARLIKPEEKWQTTFEGYNKPTYSIILEAKTDTRKFLHLCHCPKFVKYEDIPDKLKIRPADKWIERQQPFTFIPDEDILQIFNTPFSSNFNPPKNERYVFTVVVMIKFNLILFSYL